MIRRFALAAFALASLPLHATTYTLEPDYTQGVFRWNHLGFSSPAGQFAQGAGTLEFDRADPTQASVTVTIPLESLRTGVAALDDDFRSADFFDTGKFPTATFHSTHIDKGRSADQLKVNGDLTLHGVTRPVLLAVTVVKIGSNPRNGLPTIGFDATTTLKRSAFGLGRYVPQVGDEIQLHITSQAVDAKAYAQWLRDEAAADASGANGAAQK
jgi:polyisoprenoid-binding protein YceI